MATKDVMTGLRVKLGEIVIGTELGRGGFGVVHEASIKGIDFKFAIKFLDPSSYNDADEARRRFFRETELLLKLRHEHIVAIYGLGENEGRPFILMERFDGFNLEQVRTQTTPLPMDVLPFIERVASALGFAHERGVVHRDIKPRNLMTNTGRARVLDFGIAAVLDPDGTRLTRTEGIGGDAFSAPELLQDPHRREARCDVYSLGASWLYLLTGSSPKGLGWQSALRGTPEMTASYERVLLRCLDEQERRFATMAELSESLAALRAGTVPKLHPNELNDDDILVLGAVMIACTQPGTSTTYYRVEQELAGRVSAISLGVSYRKLIKLKLVVEAAERDDQGDPYTALGLTQSGESWIETNQRQVEALMAARAPTVEPAADDAIPF